MENRSTPDERAQMGAAGIAAGLGCAVVVSLVVFIGGGVLIDRMADTSPTFTLIGVVLGLGAAGYQLWELTRVGLKDRPAGPLGRQLARRPKQQRSSSSASTRRDIEEE